MSYDEKDLLVISVKEGKKKTMKKRKEREEAFARYVREELQPEDLDDEGLPLLLGLMVRVKLMVMIIFETFIISDLGQCVESVVNDVKEPRVQTVAKRFTDKDQGDQYLNLTMVGSKSTNKPQGKTSG